MKISGIYKIQSKVKPKRIYIGSSTDIEHRWNGHLCSLKKNKHHSIKLQRHFNKYGECDLQFSILLGCESIKEYLIKTEQFFIDSYKPYFNSRPKADNNLGLKRGSPWNKGKKATDEAKLNQSKSHLGQKAWNKGKKNIYSDQTLNKLKKSLKGRKAWNKGLHYKNSKMIGNTNPKGAVRSDEYREHCRISALNRKNKLKIYSEN